jgi:hypothetical protein
MTKGCCVQITRMLEIWSSGEELGLNLSIPRNTSYRKRKRGVEWKIKHLVELLVSRRRTSSQVDLPHPASYAVVPHPYITACAHAGGTGTSSASPLAASLQTGSRVVIQLRHITSACVQLYKNVPDFSTHEGIAKVQLPSAALVYTRCLKECKSILLALSPPPTQTSGTRWMFSEHWQLSCTLDIPLITEEVIYMRTRYSVTLVVATVVAVMVVAAIL